MADDYEAGAPRWWLKRLYTELAGRRPAIEKATKYYDGEHNLTFQSKRFVEAFGGLFDAFSDNWCQVVVDAAEERLNVEGFRVGEAAEGDKAAWAIWQANELDSQSQLAHTDALICGESYGVVWFGDGDTPDITVEHPTNCIVEHHPKRRRLRRAGLRVYLDDWGHEHAELFLPDAVWLFRSPSANASNLIVPESVLSWVPDPEAVKHDVRDDGSMDNPLGRVPVVPLPNKPRTLQLSKRGLLVQSEIAPIIPLQDAVNKEIADMLVGSEFFAMPQRWATGFSVDRDPVTNAPKPPSVENGKILVSEKGGAKLGSFDTGDIGAFVKAVEMLIQHIASISRTPPHYLNASADRLSGESIKAAETGLVAKVKRKTRHFGEGWEEVMRLAGQVAGEAGLADGTSMETIWADPETRTESEHIDAVIKQKALNIPDVILWEKAGYSPQEIARIKALVASEGLDRVALPTDPASSGASDT